MFAIIISLIFWGLNTSNSSTFAPFFLSMSDFPSQSRLTTILVDNLHCPSCVVTVQELLSTLRPAPFSVATSIVLHEIKVVHPITLSASRIARPLTHAGFELDNIVQSDSHNGDIEAQNYSSGSTFKRASEKKMSIATLPTKTAERELPSVTSSTTGTLPSGDTLTSVMDDRTTGIKYRISLAISGMSCSSCVGKITGVLQGRPWILSMDVNLLTSSAVLVLSDRAHVDEILETIRGSWFEVEMVDTEEIRPQRPAPRSAPAADDAWRASYIIKGMSCSSCVGKVTDTLNQYEWITKVDVNLVSGCATVEYIGKDHLEETARIIGELGYTATLSDIASQVSLNSPISVRVIQIQVDGMHCDKCPQRIVDALASTYGDKVELLGLPTSQQPRFKIRYVPEIPKRTIRDILRTIANVDKAFTVSIYHPPTLEERSQAMHRRHQWSIARRLVLAALTAIPTFTIGIVYMSLVSNNNPGKKYLNEPI
ncbi:E1-E2 ATPase-domain-containing protein [Penicillium brevicompactum]|uniref:E1-E2 ATPase-domain-containing protein n=1 Tax=Penicillium brevicompactum TaxID=5074 RepID=UPI002541E454|nr:E1-E2 ATPase-domain-containing protein [Penicillium brevicompactum]KAJ5335841.1 E1-E2 ATPase-domain-containing protein [Penicillium brevicompactum]